MNIKIKNIDDIKKAVAQWILYANLFNDETVDIPVTTVKNIYNVLTEESYPMLVSDNDKIRLWKCDKCNNNQHITDNYCSGCGRLINWGKEIY